MAASEYAACMSESTPDRQSLRTWFEPLVDERTWKRAAYLLITFPSGVFWFTTSVTLLSMAAGMLVIFVGVFILAGTLGAWRAGARLERHLAATLADTPIAEPYLQPPARGWRGLFLDPATWRDGLWLLLLFPLGITWFTVVVALWSIVGSLAASIPIVLLGGSWLSLGASVDPVFLHVDTLPEAVFATAIGVLLAPIAARVTRGAGEVHAGLAKALLGPTADELETKIESATLQRDKSVATAESERRRIERDLHDGAQQRLVAVAMELGRAKEKLDEDPDSARELVEEAHIQAKAALGELRDLARGIHPAVLTDRGLDAALSALAARSPIPVQIDYRLDRRPPVSVESTAYFVVSEALANVGKHALASFVEVTVEEGGAGIRVEVVDDGVGGAVPTGRGLSGLADRVEAVGGELSIVSPIGGPTFVTAEIPCEW